ncbi:MAG: hypothetical protein HYR49_02240 [Gammaproteobacteria bacterium]|nr:hypothetical protein [Gammaproteobacteria bacterium]
MRSLLPGCLVPLTLALALWLPGAALALSTEDVVRLHASGYPDERILEVLAATQSEFLLSAREVVYLAQSGVGNAVIQSMLAALPQQLVIEAGTSTSEPVRPKIMLEDIELLAQNQVPEPVILTFIETRDLAFSLDTERLTALRQSGLGLDALQLLVEKSAANVQVPLAPPPATVAYTGGANTYFFGRSGYSTSFDDDFQSPSPYVSIQSVAFYPWQWGYTSVHPFYPWHWGYTGFRPFYTTFYPIWGYGYFGHSFFCPRGPHHHGHGHHHHGSGQYGEPDGQNGNWPGDQQGGPGGGYAGNQNTQGSGGNGYDGETPSHIWFGGSGHHGGGNPGNGQPGKGSQGSGSKNNPTPVQAVFSFGSATKNVGSTQAVVPRVLTGLGVIAPNRGSQGGGSQTPGRIATPTGQPSYTPATIWNGARTGPVPASSNSVTSVPSAVSAAQGARDGASGGRRAVNRATKGTSGSVFAWSGRRENPR